MLQMSNLFRVQLILGKAKETEMHAECAILYGKVCSNTVTESILDKNLIGLIGIGIIWYCQFFTE